jgi:predicted GTPase
VTRDPVEMDTFIQGKPLRLIDTGGFKLDRDDGGELDDLVVGRTLETLKQEAADISKKVEETDKVIGEIETVSQQYMPLSQVCRSNCILSSFSLLAV